jgi:lipopolysaccharide export system protein LptA
MTIAAEAIDISLTADELTARGGVSTVTESSGAVEDPARSLFGGTEPVYGTADVFEYAGATGRAVYRGSPDLPARLWQGGERVSADEIIIEDTSENLSAAGRVETLFATRPGPGATSGPETDDPIDYRIAAEAFAYEGATNRATYDGNPVTMTTRDGQTIAGHLVVQLSETSGTIEWFEATDDVFAELAGGHEAKGDTLTYEAVTGTYTLTGSPAQAKSPSADGTDCALTKGLRVVFAPGTGASWQDADGSLGQTKAINCRMSIR